MHMEALKKQYDEYNLWDGLIKPAGWYFEDAGKAAFTSAFYNVDEMNGAICEGNWISITFNVCYQSRKKPLGAKKNWLLKYFYEYIISKFSTRMATNEHTLVLITAAATLKLSNGTLLLPYPDCLDEEKNPVLRYFSRVKDLLPGGYSEVTYPVLKDIVHYIYNAFSTQGKDVSEESWMYDKSFYVDYRGKPNEYVRLSEKLPELAGLPGCLSV